MAQATNRWGHPTPLQIFDLGEKISQNLVQTPDEFAAMQFKLRLFSTLAIGGQSLQRLASHEASNSSCVRGSAYSSSSYENDWDSPLRFNCPANSAITNLRSRHDNGKEDREWKFGCSSLCSTMSQGIQSGWANDWDDTMDFTCPSNSAITGLYSVHDNGKEDRKYKVVCSQPVGAQVSEGSWSGWINDWDDQMDHTCSPGTILTGMYSVHHNGKEDRKWKARCGEIVQATTSECVGSVTYLSTSYVNSMDAKVDFTCPDGALTRMISKHSDGAEDRRWKFGCNSVCGTLSGQTTSGWVNDWDDAMDYSCPSNQVVTGLYSVHNNGKEDREWKVRCATYSEGLTSGQWSDWVNGWDGDMDYACPHNTLITGLKSVHNNGKEDRRFKVKCSGLSTSAPTNAPTAPPPVSGVWTVTRGHGTWDKFTTDTFCGLDTDTFSIGHAHSIWCDSKHGTTAQVVVNQDGLTLSSGWYCSNQGSTSIQANPTFDATRGSECENKHHIEDDGQ